MRRLDEIAHDYERSEITALWYHERASARHRLLFAVAEMCPIEQRPSLAFESTDGQSTYSVCREALSEGRTLYVARAFYDTSTAALDFFRGAGSRRLALARRNGDLPGETDQVLLDSVDDLLPEPPTECPVIVSSDEGLLAGLPHRETSLRLLSLVDVQDKTSEMLGPAELERLARFSQATLGFDLSKYSEHLGAIHLCFCNPRWRSFDERLVSDGRELLFESRLRRGQTLDGSVVELIDERPTGVGFHIRHPLRSRSELIPLPTRPKKLRTLLFDAMGDCLADDSAVFLERFNLQLDLMSAKRRVRYERADGSFDEHVIHTFTPHSDGPTSREPQSAADLLERARRRRLLPELRKGDVFYYFPGGESSYQEARNVVRRLIGNARDRCVLCDVFLSAADAADFVPFVRRVKLPIRLIGSAWFLRQKVPGLDMSRGTQLSTYLKDISARDESIDVTCRILSGRAGPPIHDRFMLIDSDVFLLGSSLNEFGRRATTLFRVPDPDSIRAEMEKWWDGKGDVVTVRLDEWLAASGSPE